MNQPDPSTPAVSSASADPRDAAAYWFARVHSGDFTEQEKRTFTMWRRADPAHEREYRALDEIWQVAGLIPVDELRALAHAPAGDGLYRRSATRRHLFTAGVAFCTVAVAGSYVAINRWGGDPLFSVELRTNVGERRSETLPDGSILDLNTATTASVRYYAGRRTVELASGEIMFSVTRDTERPFVVDVGVASVRVTGTRFNVMRENDEVRVAVASGRVEVSSGKWWNRRITALTAGLGANVIGEQGVEPARQVDVQSLTAWREGKIVFKDQPLVDVVREMNRYLPQRIQIADNRLSRLSVAGVFNLDEPRTFLNALRQSLPVQTHEQADGSVTLTSLQH